MGLPLAIANRNGQTTQIEVKEMPDVCPLCHFSSQPVYICGVMHNYSDTPETLVVQLVFRCPRSACQKLFIGDYYEEIKMSDHGLVGFTFKDFNLLYLSPQQYQAKEFPDGVAAISLSFVNVFNQAAQAEAMNLIEVAGPGYRKALEFLIKDFLISEEPDKADAIKNMALMNAISNKIQDNNVKICASRAAWIGNDETHYLRIWDAHDLSDLKTLITLTVNWIESTILTRGYEVAMPNPKR